MNDSTKRDRQVQRIILEVEPPKPSTRLESLGPRATEIAERRAGTEKEDVAKRDEAREQLLASAQRELVAAWLAGLQARSAITTNEALLK